MIKLYKQTADGLLYAESWVDDDFATVHTGVVGDIGECYEEDCENAKRYLKKFKEEYESRGYRVIPDSEMYWICVKWQTESGELDNAEEERLNTAYDSLNEAFGWFGLGYADGFETSEENGGLYITLYALSVDRELGIETARNSTELYTDFTVTAEKFN
ncbi:MAG: hypothetical protein J6A07_03015 [Firmicutes bacterium]|nr:hypothetical protein [Bacillota bacterium]